jgi:hypothetical protein
MPRTVLKRCIGVCTWHYVLLIVTYRSTIQRKRWFAVASSVEFKNSTRNSLFLVADSNEMVVCCLCSFEGVNMQICEHTTLLHYAYIASLVSFIPSITGCCIFLFLHFCSSSVCVVFYQSTFHPFVHSHKFLYFIPLHTFIPPHLSYLSV